MVYETIDDLKKGCQGTLTIVDDGVEIVDSSKLRNRVIDDLIYTAVFAQAPETRSAACWLIHRAAAGMGIYPASIQTFYEAMGRGEIGGFTVPAINLRTLTYHCTQAALRAAIGGNAGPVIFEIARSEIDYTRQRPAEYAAAVLAAAVKVGYAGPLFIQGDHFQVSASKYAKDADKELKTVKDLIWEAIEAGFYNIDIDTSTLVDLSKGTLDEQQRLNYALAAELTVMIRDLEPAGITISVGGEIGEVGGKNSTVEELRAYMEGYAGELEKAGQNLKGISKISVQTGTTHGGVPLPDGTVAKVKLDFDTLERLSEVAIREYKLAGAVQHGASTLPDEAFDQFPARKTAEVHLATGYQNMIYDSEVFPQDLRNNIYSYLKREFIAEKKGEDTDEQFFYKTRKKGFGPFKRELWDLPEETLSKISGELERKFAFLYEKLKINNLRQVVDRYITPVDVPRKKPAGL